MHIRQLFEKLDHWGSDRNFCTFLESGSRRSFDTVKVEVLNVWKSLFFCKHSVQLYYITKVSNMWMFRHCGTNGTNALVIGPLTGWAQKVAMSN